MDTTATTQHLIWRRLLLSTQIYLGCYAVIVRIVGRYPTGVLYPIGIAAFVSWAFLFFAGPFFLSSHRRLAITGWCIAVAALILAGSVMKPD